MAKEGLSAVDIGNFCLLESKYKEYLIENGQSVSDSAEMRNGVSESVSSLLEIMDRCQKVLYNTDYSEENIEDMLKLKEVFAGGIKTLEEVLKGFEIVTCGRGNIGLYD